MQMDNINTKVDKAAVHLHTFFGHGIESSRLFSSNYYRNNNLCSQRWRNSMHPAKKRPGADCGSDHELLIAKFRLKLKKVGKTTRPLRYDLNQFL